MALNVTITIGQEDFSINFFGINLGRFNLILGVDYLKTLGPILWDLEDLCMAFNRGGRRMF